MAEHVYEGLFILDSSAYARDPGGVSGQIDDVLTRLGAEILASRLWEERRLAYPINGHKKGTYWLTYFRMDSTKVPGIRREFEISDTVLRHLVLRIDPRLADAMVAHATGADRAEEETDSEAVAQSDTEPAATTE